MTELGPALLVNETEFFGGSVPWSASLENLELAILLSSQPWLSRDGWRRADLERELQRLARTLPVGEIYFQRIRRAVKKLEDAALLHGSGAGRSRRFTTAPAGFAALLLNLRTLRRDPTLDGTEFEFKRALVMLWNLLLESSRLLAGEVPIDPAIRCYFDEVGDLEVLGRRVITHESFESAMDLSQLVALQRANIEKRLREVEALGSRPAKQRQAPIESLRGERFATAGFSDPATLLSTHPTAQQAIRSAAGSALATATHGVAKLRYTTYLEYLDSLDQLHRQSIPRLRIRLFDDRHAV